jgi:ApaG protein
MTFNMVTKVTEGIVVSVDTIYEEGQSRPTEHLFLFSYHITIENKTTEKIQLLRRYWQIFDSNGEYREVEGPGVVGEQPILLPGEKYAYESFCNLKTDMGKMKGTYTFERLKDSRMFIAEIPEFKMVVPSKLN